MGLPRWVTLCNCGRGSPSQSCSKGSIQRRGIGLTPGADEDACDVPGRRRRGVAEVRLCRFLVARAVSDRSLSWRGCGPSSPHGFWLEKALKTTLNAEINEEAWAPLNSATSRAFDKPKSGWIAVKVINYLRDEMMKVFR